ncbi:MAG: hypothetical protein KBB32_11370 [Spirochaetia bacterium]|nr:hypothetical protein [Spirochaetia bacterium]
MAKFCLALSAALTLAAAVYGLDVDAGLELGASTETPNALWGSVNGGFSLDADAFELFGEMFLDNRGLYGGFFGGQFGYGGLSFSFGEAGLRYSGGLFTLEAGRLVLKDILDSPYSLFLSSRDNVALGGALLYDDGVFAYSSRWVALNYDVRDTVNPELPDTPVPDRSAIIKSWSLRLGSFRVAFQDAAVITNLADIEASADPTLDRGPLFDPEYFLVPLPGFFIQYIGFRQDAPWEKRVLDDNSIMGFLVDWDEGPWYAALQVLVDDFNANRFINPDGNQNPDKLAWTLGGRWDGGALGTFGFWHAGATMYTFQPYGSSGVNKQYGYTFYPYVSYYVDGLPLAFEPEANYLGYLHGENNLAFMATWDGQAAGLTLAGTLEFTLSGSKSPANPWHEYESYLDYGEGTRFLDDPVLEKKVVLTASASFPLGDFELGAECGLGGVWNRLALSPSGSVDLENVISIYRPSAEHGLIAWFTLGARYRLSL